MKVIGLPNVTVRCGISLDERVDHMLSAVSSSRSPDLPERRISHRLEVGARRTELGMVEDGLALREIFQHRHEFPICR